MAGRVRGKKRKSEDFIYEVNNTDLSSEDDSVTNSKRKLNKIDGEVMESSKTDNMLSNKEKNKKANESVVLDTDKSDKMEKTQSCVDKSSPVMEKISEEGISPEEGKNSNVIIINDSQDFNESCIIIDPDPIPVMVVSDDEVEEEGEIIEDLEIVDETPRKELVVIKTPEKDDEKEVLSVAGEEFKVVEEIGPSPMPTENRNLINISFRCEKTMNQYGHLLAKFLKSFPEIEVAKNKLSITVNEKEIFEETATPKKRNKKKKAKKELFVVDPNPSSNDDNSQFLQFRYTSKFEIREEAEPETVKKNISAKVCFNCDGQHALRDCGIPKNFRRINQARQQFLERNKTVRYHVNQNPKLDDLKPGVISENLRKALGLGKNEIPDHIYKMRHLGYPPGWLEEAKILPSNLSLFDIDGEQMENRTMEKSCLDPSKVIDYPGFNMPPKKGCFDDFRRHNVKPYAKWMHKSAMIKHFEENCEKDIVGNTDVDKSKPKEVEKKTIEKKVKDKAAAPVNSPSLVDLEEKKKEIMDQLVLGQEEVKSSSNESEGDTSQEIPEDNEEKEASVAVMTTQLGTPILKSDSPYSRLPNPDNFSVGVSPVIDFENLPNSTGKYEELSKVLSKVRMTMKNVL